jgi:hypothetical protein
MEDKSKKELFARVGMRFLRGFIAAFVPLLAATLQSMDFGWAAVVSVLCASLSAAFLAVDKLLRSQTWYKDLHK